VSEGRAPIRVERRQLAGVGTVVREAGPADAGTAVVYIHGSPGTSADWLDLMSRTGQFARSVAIDLPNFGESDRLADFDASVPGYGAWLEGALDALGVQRAHLVTHDFGGSFALNWATRRPGAAASIVAMNIGPLPGYEWHRTAKLWRTRGVGEAIQALVTPKVMSAGMRRDNPRLPKAEADRMARFYDRGTKRNVLRLYRATDTASPGLDAAAVKALALPALAVWGGADPYITPDFAERLPEILLPGCRVVILPDAGHWVFLDEPERAAAEIVPFLREHAA
jgi:pimeloyl-ACP methyl ester carboxylesterase